MLFATTSQSEQSRWCARSVTETRRRFSPCRHSSTAPQCQKISPLGSAKVEIPGLSVPHDAGQASNRLRACANPARIRARVQGGGGGGGSCAAGSGGNTCMVMMGWGRMWSAGGNAGGSWSFSPDRAPMRSWKSRLSWLNFCPPASAASRSVLRSPICYHRRLLRSVAGLRLPTTLTTAMLGVLSLAHDLQHMAIRHVQGQQW